MPPSPIPTAVKFHKRIRTVQAAGAAQDGASAMAAAARFARIAIGAEAGEVSNDGIGCNI